MNHRRAPEPFEPAWWCLNPHAQTLWHAVVRRAPRIPWRREVLDLPDGDFLDVDWLGSSKRTALLIHGLCGSSRSRYIRSLAARLNARGYRVAALNLRGASGRPNRRPRTYHSGLTSDLDHVITVLTKRDRDIELHCAGFSLGGNLLLKWLGEHPATVRVRSAVAVSVPYHLEQAAIRMKHGMSRIYQEHLLRALRRSTILRRRLLGGRFDPESCARAADFRAFDDAVTAPVNGFSDASEYYARCSSHRFLKHVTVPTLLLHARDDPFMTTAVIPNRAELSPSVDLEIYERGGHVGFVTGPAPGFSRYWLDERIPAHFEAFSDRG